MSEFDAGKALALCEQAEKLASEATPGPWEPEWTYSSHDNIKFTSYDACGTGPIHGGTSLERVQPQAEADAAFIAASRGLVPALAAALRQSVVEVERVTAENKALGILNREWTGEIRAQALLNERKPFEHDIEKYARKLEEAWGVNAHLTAERDALIGELKKIAGREMDNFNDVTQLDQCINIAIEALQKIGSGKAQSIDTAYLIARDALQAMRVEPTSPKGDPADWLAGLRQRGGG